MAEAFWQCSKQSLRERAAYIFANRMQTDCVVLVSDPTGTDPARFETHKLFLSMASPVFERMFEAKCKERDESVIEIKDIDPEIFRKIIQYIYTDKFEVDSTEEAVSVYIAADKYLLTHLVSECRVYLASHTNIENVCRMFEFAQFFGAQGLAEDCMDLIKKRTSAVLIQKPFLSIKPTTLVTIYKQDTLNILSESQLFAALERYAHHNNMERRNPMQGVVERLDNGDLSIICDEKYEALMDALESIRFLTLSSREFAASGARSNLLLDSEKLAIFMNIADPVAGHPMPIGFCMYRTQRRSVSPSVCEDVFRTRALISTINNVYLNYNDLIISPRAQAEANNVAAYANSARFGQETDYEGMD